jgi:hypothetical protein
MRQPKSSLLDQHQQGEIRGAEAPSRLSDKVLRRHCEARGIADSLPQSLQAGSLDHERKQSPNKPPTARARSRSRACGSLSCPEVSQKRPHYGQLGRIHLAALERGPVADFSDRFVVLGDQPSGGEPCLNASTPSRRVQLRRGAIRRQCPSTLPTRVRGSGCQSLRRGP